MSRPSQGATNLPASRSSSPKENSAARGDRSFPCPGTGHRRSAMTLTRPALITSAAGQVVRLPDPVRHRLVSTVSAVHAAGLKSVGLLVAAPEHRDFPFTA